MKRALIAEDHGDTRRWLADLVTTAFPGCHVDGAATLSGAIDAGRRNAYDLALIDLGLPDGSGVDALRLLRAARPETVCIVATALADDASIVAALAAGAHGYLLKEDPAELLVRQLQQVGDGATPLSPSVARRIMEHFRDTGPTAQPQDELTPRESEVLTLIARGLRNVDAARALGSAESTVASHIKAIYRKLGISSRAEAASHATRLGLGSRPPR